MTLLQLIKAFCQRTGLPRPSAVVASQDAQIIQILGLLHEVCEDIVERWDWQELCQEATFITVAAEDQGPLSTIAPLDLSRIVDNTIFNRTQKLPIYGPVTGRKWQAQQALPVGGPYSEYRIRGGHLYLTPAPAAGHLCAFEYFSKRLILSQDTVTLLSEFASDNDTPLLDSTILLAGLRWKWKSEKGLPYAEDRARYESLASSAAGRSGTKPELRMDDEVSKAMPGIFVSPGNWSLP